MSWLLGERDRNFKPSRFACYWRFFGFAAAGWLLAIGAINRWLHLPRILTTASGWHWIPFLIFWFIAILAASIGFFWLLSQLGKWEGPITDFINADVDRLAKRTPFPEACRKLLYVAITVLFLPWLLAFFGSSE